MVCWGVSEPPRHPSSCCIAAAAVWLRVMLSAFKFGRSGPGPDRPPLPLSSPVKRRGKCDHSATAVMP